jgi:hypothetical protein
MMHDKSNTDSKASNARANRLQPLPLKGWDHAAMTKAVWALADCPVLSLFADVASEDQRQYH